MAEYIERDRLYELVYWHGATPTLDNPFPDGVDAVDTKDIDSIPAADVRPVVHGRWIPMTYIKELTQNGWPNCRWEKAIEPDSVDGLMCSECGEIFDFADARNFCTQCGADMSPEGRTEE